ncbi:MAG: ATP-binding cassette domain-containing protein [Firmicutes bacterium]|nr:ATP-binding cassette domain-containing protein [Bacillota bacterium]
MEILTVRDLSFKYSLGREDAVSGISFGVEEGAFVAVCGPTGCGKSTLLRMLKKELIPMGDMRGEVLLDGVPLSEIDVRTSASAVGFVMQRPEHQIVTDKVWHELAFGLENLGMPQDVIRRRVSEIAAYFDIEDWFEKDVSELSGGQKQLLNLASIMVMQPRLLILDEPTSQLDPIAASDFIATVRKLNTDMGLTVIMVEHRLQEVIPAASRLLVMDKGRLLHYGPTRQVCEEVSDRPDLLAAMPSTVRLFKIMDGEGECPLTISEGRRWAESFGNDVQPDFAQMDEQGGAPDGKQETGAADRKHGGDTNSGASVESVPDSDVPAMEFDDVWFRYGRDLHDVLRGTTLSVKQGEIFCILGGNGSGKTTCLGAAAGLNKPYSGTVKVFGKNVRDYRNQSLYRNCLTMLPQDVQTIFLKNTVREELKDAGESAGKLPYDIDSLMDKHPYDLSGGEQQLVALAKVLASEPKLLLLDEPTKGIDTYSSERISGILKDLRDSGMTIVIVTHDVEFAARTADRCAMFFRGEVTSVDEPRAFFSENNFYTTAVNRMTRGLFKGCVTLEDAVYALRLQKQPAGKDG